MSTSTSSKLPLSTLLLPHLPVELLRQIIEQSVPSHYHSSTYSQRQLILRNVCLTCRLFRQIAQPLLEQFDQFRLLGKGVYDSETCDISSRTSRAETGSVLAHQGIGPSGFHSLVYAYPSIRELHISVGKRNSIRMNLSLLTSMNCERTVCYLSQKMIDVIRFVSQQLSRIYRYLPASSTWKIRSHSPLYVA